MAKITFRLVPNQDGDKILKLAHKHLEKHLPPGVTMEITDGHSGPWYLTDPHSAFGEAAQEALKEAFGGEVALIREGGSIPIVSQFRDILGVETLLIGLALPDCRAHSPNENFPLENLEAGMKMNQAILQKARPPERTCGDSSRSSLVLAARPRGLDAGRGGVVRREDQKHLRDADADAAPTSQAEHEEESSPTPTPSPSPKKKHKSSPTPSPEEDETPTPKKKKKKSSPTPTPTESPTPTATPTATPEESASPSPEPTASPGGKLNRRDDRAVTRSKATTRIRLRFERSSTAPSL